MIAANGRFMTIQSWYLKKGSEKKFRFGHPWVFSSELAQSPKGVVPGAPIELRDHQGGFLALGYGHPQSQISFRTLSTRAGSLIDQAFVLERLKKAASLRRVAGVLPYSHRLIFAEGDGLPGLIVDRFILESRDAQVFVLQASTAGMDRLLDMVTAALEVFVREEHQAIESMPNWERTSLVFANDTKARVMEGLPVEEKRVVREGKGFDSSAVRIVIEPSSPELPPLVFDVDLLEGQKTGFFLDQRFNVGLTARLVRGLIASGRRDLKILDLCCYVGQWGAQLAHLASSLGVRAQVTCADASARALELAVRNVERHGGKAEPLKMDVLDELGKIESRVYDVVICDPPAFIKKKKDLPTGSQAYFKMNREAVRKVNSGGVYVSCSCSGLFGEQEFREMLARVSSAYGGEIRWLMRGGHSADHPQRPEFPQGTYLKAWMGVMP